MSDTPLWRQDFPIFQESGGHKPLTYLDTAATSQKPQVVIDTISKFYSHDYGTVNRAVYSLAAQATERYQAVRHTVQRFINAESPEEIVFTRGTTESINFVAYAFGKAFIQEGDEILIPEIEHHSNIVPWQLMAEDRGACVRSLPVKDDGSLCLESYKGALSSKTKLVAIAHVSNSLGTVHPIKTIVGLAHGVGAKVFVDGAQAAPQVLVDVQDLDADFYAFSAHKAYGPTGVGVLYGKFALLEQLPPAHGGGDMIDQVSFEKTTYAPPPIKFEPGTPPIAQVLGMGAACQYLMDIGMQKVHCYEQNLLYYATTELKQIPGLCIIGHAPQKVGIVSFVVEGVHHLDLGTLLDLEGFAIRTGHHCTQPAMKRFGVSGTCRLSFGIYNTLSEIDHFIISLKNCINKLG